MMDFCSFIIDILPEEPADPWQGAAIVKVEVLSQSGLWRLFVHVSQLVAAEIVDDLANRLNSGPSPCAIELVLHPLEDSLSVLDTINGDLKNLLAQEEPYCTDIGWSVQRSLV
jgi:hypothetical protein